MKKIIVILLIAVTLLSVVLMRSCNTAEEQDSNLSSTEAVQVVAYSEQTSDGYVVYTDSDKEKINFSRCSKYAKRLLENYIINNNFSEKKPEDIEWALRETHAVVYYLVDEQWWAFKLDGDNFKTIKYNSDKIYSSVYINRDKSQEEKDIDEKIEKNAITDKDFMKYLHKWSKINIKKVYIVKGDENESLNIYYKCDGKWYFCKKALSLKTIKDNEMLDSSIIEKIEESIE